MWGRRVYWKSVEIFCDECSVSLDVGTAELCMPCWVECVVK